MKISYNWLREYVHLDDAPKAVGDALTMVGLEMDDLDVVGSTFDGVVVGHVLEARPHPNADTLTLCQVDLGSGAPVQIVCGAPNVAAGQKVPVATVGTTLMLPSRNNPEEKVPVTLKKAKLRGEVSQGMICAEDELGLSDDHEGIMVLEADAPAGQPFVDCLTAQGLEVQDHVFDIAITPNRPDAVSHIGMARDLAAISEQPLRKPDVVIPPNGGPVADEITIRIEAPEACHRYVGILVKGVTIQESPAWLQQRLTAVGLRPINNVVDVTNYVMYECGQPLHAFDADEIADSTIIIRRTETPDEPFITLDSTERKLPLGTLMICDAERPVAVAGVMGGENSEVSDQTTNVLIESAYFDPSLIRKTAKALGLQTDASYRFERGVDTDGQAWAAARAAQLMVEVGGGTQVEGMVDVHPTPPAPPTLPLRLSRIETILGIPVPRNTTIRLLKAIGFGVESGDDDTLHCTIPTYRPDVEREIDIIEEVARLYGYDHIPEPPRTAIPNEAPHASVPHALRLDIRSRLAGLGYREIYTNSMLRQETAEQFSVPVLHGQPGAVVTTLNPISQEMAALRPSLLPGVLQVMSHNQKHGQQVLRFMEWGHVFQRTDNPHVMVAGYDERDMLVLALSGPSSVTQWNREPRETDFFDLKGVVEMILDVLQIPHVTMEADYTPTAITSYHVRIRSKKKVLGVMGQLADSLAESYDLKTPVYFAELNWERLVALATSNYDVTYQTVSRFPTVERDLALVVDRAQAVGPMLRTIEEAGHPLVQEVSVFDLYEGEHIAAGKKSVAFSVRFGADRTLKDKDVDKRVRAILNRLQREYGAALRQ